MIQELQQLVQLTQIQTQTIDNLRLTVENQLVPTLNGLINEFQSTINQLNQSTQQVVSNASNSSGQRGIGPLDPDEGPRTSGRAANNRLIALLNRLSIPLPGGVRLFELGEIFPNLTAAIKKVPPAVANAVFAFSLITGAVIKANQAFVNLAKELGGISPSQARQQFIASIGQSFVALFREGRIVSPSEIRAIQGAFSQEFGQLVTSESARLLAGAAQDLGLNVNQLISLERALQGTGRESRDAINQFRRVGITSQVAAQELTKNATAVARAGGEFNSFIVEGIRNAKRLGLEFNQIEKTLTGFATDFEGTVESFARARALVPGFATDFSELFSVALDGSTDDLINIVRRDLQGAGITDISQLDRNALKSIEDATGFTGEQLNRILNNEDVNFDVQESLDTSRNDLLKHILFALPIIAGAIIGGVVGGIYGAIALIPGVGQVVAGANILGSIGGATAGGALVGTAIGGTIAGYNALTEEPDADVDDAIIQNGQIITTDPADTLIATKTPEELTSTTQEVNIDLSKLERKLDEINMTLQRNKKVEITGIDTGLESLQQRTIRNY